MIRYEDITVTAAGEGIGSAVGTAYSRTVVTGEILAVHFNYSGTPTTTDATLLTRSSPQATILGVSDNVTDGWYYPRIGLHGTAGGTVTLDGTQPIYGPIIVADQLELRLAQAKAADTLTARVIWRY